MDRRDRVRISQDLERPDGGRRRDPVAGVRAAVADLAGSRLMTVAPSPEGGGRVAVAHRLGERREVRRDAEVLGGAAVREPEAGLHLVEDQEDPELPGEGPDRLVETRLRQDPLGVADHRLER